MLLANILLYFNVSIYRKRKQVAVSWLENFIHSSVIWMLFLFACTEILSIFHLLNKITLLTVWGLADILLMVSLAIQCRKYPQRETWSISAVIKAARVSLKNMHPLIWILVICGVGVFYLALKTVPYNWDSMTYHLSRIAAWAQNQSVAHYATNIIRELASPVLGEFVNLHVYILMGEQDTLFNLLQCFSYFVCAVMVYGISKKLGCEKILCALAAMLYMAMPIAYAEALTTQVDNFSTVWLVFFVYIMLDFTLGSEKIQWNALTVQRVCVMGLCVAWGYLTKPSVCVAMLLFVLGLLLVCIVRKDNVFTLSKLILCTLPCIVLPILPEILRNFGTFNAFSSPIAGARQLVGTGNPLYLFINFTKNFVFNLPTNYWTGSVEFWKKVPRKLAEILGVELDHASISEDGAAFMLHGVNYGHDTAISPMIVWLLIFCVLVAVLTLRRIEWKSLYKSYSVTVTAAFLLFCVILRWEPYVGRYMVPFMALLCPMVVLQIQRVLGGFGTKFVKIRYGVIAVLVCMCIVEIINMYGFHSKMCTQYGAGERPYGYFTNRTTEYEVYTAMSGQILEAGYQDIGFYSGENHYEYPFWVLLAENDATIKHVNVENDSAIYLDESFVPDCIIWLSASPVETFALGDVKYPNVKTFGDGYYLLCK